MQTGESRAERLRKSPVHRAVIGKKRVMGVPFNYTVMLFSGSFSFAWVTQQWPLALLPFILFAGLRYIYKDEPYFVEVYFRYIRQHERYEPWPHASFQDQRPKDLIGHGKAW
ncbi:VirB3 family type IV secretion system protein [Acidithiobacillus thiooxidans]|jgi:type IV secretory pathway TrbD component|uniref:Type IV secretion system protein VirB3 n=1 Tax=Acidithiobacillus thiooxidans ATCC 19377 TaxID=637390 RepID=A0A543Q217_ACITH|nr:VirB3 family type IV secretion system protein [Acidithiobacillus thiooxidans]MBU2753043.1 hypothetical protein [Acidithiobacillus thiooxidans]MBU2836903.1 hypothetical protein [Acidithiobacillus thiooxidans]MDX5935485.1 VirB3 family type IV secretion system protein [Acidithiobacillus thiooxidans]QFX96153.1 hypothetical protein GCD22_01878 [Acidithiobacillus thiooxidans ATCC 19377]TQN50374.1 hypothetical protein DLNHIDIE_00227 [Acidithiobacillus thiooxidans ATCC 19377]